MAWDLVCKNAFCARMQDRISHGSNVSQALREVSKEVEIPFKTLERWWYQESGEENSLKNEVLPSRSNQIKGLQLSINRLIKRIAKLELSDKEKDQIKPHIKKLLEEVYHGN